MSTFPARAGSGSQGRLGGGHACVGAHCFGPAHAIAAGLCVAGAAAACAIALRSRELYARIADAQRRAKAGERERAAGGAIAPDAEAALPRAAQGLGATAAGAGAADAGACGARKPWDSAPADFI